MKSQWVTHFSSRQDNDGYIRLDDSIKKGDMVEVLQGPLAGLEAVFEKEIKPAERVWVLMDILGSRTRMEMNPGSLRKMG